MLDLLQALRFTIDRKKSRLLDPNQLFSHFTFLGFSINSLTMLFSLPEKKILTLQNKLNVNRCCATPPPSARKVASLIKKLEVARPAIWQAPLTDRSLQIKLIKYLKASHRNYETSVHLNSNTQTEPLRRWFQKLTTLDGIVINSFDSDL